MHTIIMQKNKRKHIYQVNYTIAISICIHFYKYQGVAPPDIEALIQMNILPVRTGRSDSRKVKSKATVSFLYRVA